MDLSYVSSKNTQELLHDSPATPSVLKDFGLSMLKFGAVDPVRAVLQIVDRATSNVLNLEQSVNLAADTFGYEPVAPAEFSTMRWYAQQVGSAVGLMVPYLVCRTAVKEGASSLLGSYRMRHMYLDGLKSPLGSRTMARIAGTEGALSGVSGFAYGALLVPTESPNGSIGNFVKNRLEHGLFDAASFASLGTLMPYTGKAIDKFARAVETAHIGKPGNFRFQNYEVAAPISQALKQASSYASMALRNPILNGSISGVPVGLVNAQVGAFRSGELIPEAKNVKESVVATMFTGSALAGVKRLSGHSLAKESSTHNFYQGLDIYRVRRIEWLE